MLDVQDFYHGAALVQLANHRAFTALNRASNRYGHYVVNTDRRCFVKYATRKKSPWRFTFLRDEVRAIARDEKMPGQTFVILVCGETAICALTTHELWQVIDPKAPGSQQVRIDAPPGCSFDVTGPNRYYLQRKVPRNAFPSKVLR